MFANGLIDLHGREVLPCKYHYMEPPTCGLMMCKQKQGDKAGFIDIAGKFVIPPTFDNAQPFDVKSGLAGVMVKRDGVDNYGLIDPTGRVVIKPVYETLEQPAEGLCRFRPQGSKLYGFLDLTGAVAIPARFREATDFHFGLAGVADADNYDECYFIDHAGRKVLGPYANGPIDFCPPGVAAVEVATTHKWHLIDRGGRVLAVRPPGIEPGYPAFGECEWHDEKTGKLGRRQAETGRWIVPPKYDDIHKSTFGSFYRVKADGLEGLLDLSGREISPLGARRFSGAAYGCERIAFHDGPEEYKLGKWGYLTVPGGEVLIPAKYTYASRYSEGFAVYAK